MAVTLKTGRPVRGEEIIIERPDGVRRCVVPYPTALHDADGNVVGGINMLVDTTDRQRALETLRDSDRRKSEFLVTLAHELKGPLAPVCNSLEILHRVIRGETFDQFPAPRAGSETAQLVSSALDVLDRQIGQMARLVDDLLDVERIGRGTITLRRDRVDLGQVVSQAVEAARPLLDQMLHRLTVSLPPEPIILEADSARLAQLVGNLLNNACKFTDEGGHVWVIVERIGPDSVVIRVRDTGIGISREQLPRVFEMFAQSSTSLERPQSGLGIGLALVKTLAELHGGTVEAQSSGLGLGAEFIVRLPTPKPEPALLAQTPTKAPHLRGLRILVVDDNRDAAESLAMLLEFNGHETYLAHDGAAAVEAALQFQPDAIFLDLGLPVLNGYEVARRIRERNLARQPLLVAVTGWGQEEHRQRSTDAGFDAHVVKPIDDGTLMSLLAELGARSNSSDGVH